MNEGFIRIPNELMEVLMSEVINDSEKRILLFIARKTYGYNKKSDQISLTQFENKLNLSRQTVNVTTQRMRLVKLLRLVKKGKSRLACNEWLIDLSDYQDKLVQLGRLVKYDSDKLVKVGRHTIDSITKDKEKKEISFSQDVKSLSRDEWMAQAKLENPDIPDLEDRIEW
ncbi:replication protein [Candidatus Daviesbacteria bacterium]|nr:replication protein [Candidatus Daviesbacteria bacterium]